MKTVTLYTGTNILRGKDLLRGYFPSLSWWSDNYDTVLHYYEGCIIKMDVLLDEDKKLFYVDSYEDLIDHNVLLPCYTYGDVKVDIPEGATWYSFSDEYLKGHFVETSRISLKKLNSIFKKER